jgi:hypothetical protein
MEQQRYTDPTTGHQYEVGPDGTSRWVTPSAPTQPVAGSPLRAAPGTPSQPWLSRLSGVNAGLLVALVVVSVVAVVLLVALLLSRPSSDSASPPAGPGAVSGQGAATDAGPGAAPGSADTGVTIINPPGTVRMDNWVIESAQLGPKPGAPKLYSGQMTVKNDSSLTRSGMMIVYFRDPTTKTEVCSFLEMLQDMGPGETRTVPFRLNPPGYRPGKVQMYLNASTSPALKIAPGGS